MNPAIRTLICLACFGGLAMLSSCGSSSDTPTTVSLRLVNATRHASLNVVMNGSSELSAVPAAGASAYESITAGTYSITVTDASATLASATQSLGLTGGDAYTLLASDRDGAINMTLIPEIQPVPAAGYGTLNISNLSLDAGSLDVYVVAPGTTSLIGLAPAFQFVGYSATPSSTTLVAGTYEIVATAAGSVDDVRLTLPSVTVANLQILTLALTGTPGGGLVNGVLLTQGGSVQFAPTAYARVRVVSGLPSAASIPVVGTVAAATLPTVFAPNPGTYTLVTGGASIYSISVSGAPVAALPAATFATGGDFTILVYGSAASPVVSVFIDDNQAPAGGDVNLRLVNAAVNAPGGLTMYDNGVEAASSIGYGSASTYFGVVLSNTSNLELIEPSVAPVIDTVSLTEPQSVYTVFVVDSSLTPYVIRDR